MHALGITSTVGSVELADAWIDPSRTDSPRDSGQPPRRATVVLAATLAATVLVVVVWARFFSGVSAAPVPRSFMNAVPAAGASPSVTAPTGTPAAAASATGTIAPAGQPQTTAALVPELTSSSAPEPPVDAAWLSSVSAATGLSSRALQAYAGAELELEREKPSCRLGWNTLAGIGKIESNNGRTLTAAGYSTSPILGPIVRGNLQAEGPMQFMPGTWAKWGADGNGDGVADPNQIDDAALAAARYLCSYGELDTATGWHAAVFGYNHLDSYVAAVAVQATRYAESAEGID